MTTTKDLVEAHSFSRRRLVTAFVSGAPGGREVEPVRRGRTLLAGVAVAVLLVAGAAVLGIVRSPSTVDWTREGLVSDRDSGADYLVLRTADDSDDDARTEVRPLANTTSAMLVLGPDMSSTEVAGDEVDEQPRGLPIGIAGAPETPPRASALVPTGWTACTGGGAPDDPSGVRLRLADEPGVTATPDLAFLVRTVSGGLHLLAQAPAGVGGGDDDERAYAYPVPDTPRTDNLLDAVAGTDEGRAVTVPDAWIGLFPEGGALEQASFGVDEAELDDAWPLRDRLREDDARTGAEIGDLLEVDGRSYLLTDDGVRALSGFASSLYEQLVFPAGDDLASYEVARLPEADVSTDPLPGTSWPESTVDTGAPAQHLCALLDTTGPQPGVRLATTAAGGDASAERVPLDEVERTVEPGHGAFVSSGGWSGDDVTGPVLVDDTGRAHPVGAGEEAERLGYGGVDEVVVPAPWIDLWEPGALLTVEAALARPQPQAGSRPRRSSRCRSRVCTDGSAPSSSASRER